MKWALPAALTFSLLGPYCHAAKDPSASSLFKQGEAAEAKDDYLTAFDDYSRAFQKNPKDLRYKTAYERLRFQAAAVHVSRGEKLRDGGDLSGAMTEFMRALEIDPSNQLAQQDIQATREKEAAPRSDQETSIDHSPASALGSVQSPTELKPIANEPITLHMTEDSKIVYQTVGKAAGINVLFDPEYTSRRVTVDLANVSLGDALRIIGTISGTFWRPVTSNTIFVAMNTRAKRQELEEQAVQTFYLANTSQANDLNDVQTALRNLLLNAKLYGVPSQNAIVMRATPDELLLAQKLIGDLDKARPEVVVDVAVLEVDRDKLRNIGVQLPGSFGVQLQPSNATSTTNTGTGTTGTTTTTTGTTTNNLTLNDLNNLNATNFAVTVGQATANLLLTDNDTRILQNPRIRATDGQKADLKVGSRIPVATGSFQAGAATAVVSSLVNTQFTYLDVGVEIEITPVVHYDRDVTLKLKIVVSQENGQSNLGGIQEPIISQRTIEQTIRLKEGEANILGGILQRQDTRSVGGTPGLGEIPLLKYLFSSQSHEMIHNEIVFLLIPHVVRATELSPLNLREIDTGTGTNVELRRIAAQPGAQQNRSIPAMHPVPSGAEIPTGQRSAASAADSAATAMQQSANANTQTAPVTMQIVPPPAPPKVGSSFQVAVNLAGGQDVFSVPLQLHYDSSKLTLINVDSGNFLGRDGQAIALVHRDDGSGNVVISASRPPGVAGVAGSGTVALLTFQANAPGDAPIEITRATVKTSTQQSISAVGSQATVHVQ